MQLATKAAGGDQTAMQDLDWFDEIETRASAVKPTQFPLSAPDIEVLRAAYERMKQCNTEKTEKDMAPSPANIYADLLQNDLCAFIHRSSGVEFSANVFPNWHIELLAAKLEEVRRGNCKRLIVSVPPRHLKSHATSIAFPAWVMGHEPAKQILVVTYATRSVRQARTESRTLMMSFYQGLFDTRLSKGREAVSEYETTAGGYRIRHQ